MFRRAIKIKSSTTLKGSAKKRLVQQVLGKFPNMTEDDFYSIFPRKDNILEVKICSNSKFYMVYSVQNIPLLIENEKSYIPTVFLLWQHPSFVKTVTTHEPVIDKLINGADLMIPGLKFQDEDECYPCFEKDEVVSIAIQSNFASLAVGTTAISSESINSNNAHGKAVLIMHTINDELYKLAQHPPEKPIITSDILSKKSDENAETSKSQEECTTNTAEAESEIEPVKSEEVTDQNIDYNYILKKYFLVGLLNLPKDSLPILTSIFYKTKFLSALPEDVNFDIKKTSYKKLSGFVKNLANNLIIGMEEVQGVQKIISVDYSHPEFVEFIQFKESGQSKQPQKKQKVLIEEMYRITSGGLQILGHYNYKKGDLITPGDVRTHVMEYVKKKQVEPSPVKGCVFLDDELVSILKTKERQITWKELFDKFFHLLSVVSIVTLPNGQQVKQNSKLHPIDIKVASRCNNKKVTIVSNLQTFGIDVKDFAHDCQLAVAASATVNELPGHQKDLQCQIQGNHAIMIRKVLLGIKCPYQKIYIL